jgi:hypothetical protein
MLQLIPKDPAPPYGQFLTRNDENKATQNNNHPQEPFLFDFREVSHDLYHVNFQDLFHGLSCSFTIEKKSSFPQTEELAEDSNFLESIISCDYPVIDVERLLKKVLGEEYLYCMILIQFQLKILEQLILFAEGHNASNFVLNFNEANLDYIEIYEQFLISQEEILTARGEQTEITIPMDISLYDELIDHMDKVDREFQRTLWCKQKNNPILRHYLKSKALL